MTSDLAGNADVEKSPLKIEVLYAEDVNDDRGERQTLPAN